MQAAPLTSPAETVLEALRELHDASSELSLIIPEFVQREPKLHFRWVMAAERARRLLEGT